MNTAGKKILTANENPVIGELENERDDCARAASVRISMIKSEYFRAVECKATSSKNSNNERKDQGHPTQPSIAHGVTNTELTGTSIITKFAGFTEAVRQLPTGSAGF
jgi:hypothetical protein